jgi:opacity protein-like surface antigen
MRKSSLAAILLFSLPFLVPARIGAQLDIAISGYGAFQQVTSGPGFVVSPANQAGASIEVRRIVHPWLGYEGFYAFNRANQSYSTVTYAVCGVCVISTSWTPVPVDAHEIAGAWVAALKIAHLRSFALAGAGVLLHQPVTSQATTTTVVTGCGGGNPYCTPGQVTTSTTHTTASTKAVFVYGAGLDWAVVPHLGLRLQYRGNVYQSSNLVAAFSSASNFTHTAEPMIGAYFRF